MPGPGIGSGGPRSGVRPRRDGGFSATLGSPDQHQDDAAMKAAVKQKQLQQQLSSNKKSSGKGGSQPVAQASRQEKAAQLDQNLPQAESGREVRSLKEELVKRPVKDVKKGLASLVDLNDLLSIETGDTPEEKAKKKQIHQRYQKLTEEQQTVAKKQYQEKLQKRKQEQEEEQRKKEAEQAQQQQAMAPPSSPQKGPIGPASGMSRKKKAQTNLQQQRQGLGSVGQKH